jgi:alpha-ketoglutarate-dependent taurine dioxygenase
MNESEFAGPGKKMPLHHARALNLSPESLILVEPSSGERRFPLVLRPAADGIDLIAWAAGARAFIEENLSKHGALLLRGFDVGNADRFERFIEAISGELLEYKERSSPRSHVSGRIYTSTDYPNDQNIFLHNENSYQNTWPMRIYFFCLTPPESGGETPIADCRRIIDLIDPEIKDRFSRKQVMYVRNYMDGIGLDWRTVFQSTERRVVEEHCLRAGIEFEWREGGRLRTRAVRPAIVKHPYTNEEVWFNHATFFHVSTLEPGIKETLLRAFEEEDLPTNSYYGDGSPIEAGVLDDLRDIYQREAVRFPWKRGDILMLDNMLSAHGRAAFAGRRQILVGMSNPYSRSDHNRYE